MTASPKGKVCNLNSLLPMSYLIKELKTQQFTITSHIFEVNFNKCK